jgi:hypothetical protein
MLTLDKAIKDTMEDIQPFIDQATSEGVSRFDASRIREPERELSDDNAEFFESEIRDRIEKLGVSMEYSQYDDYELVSNDFEIDRDTGEARRIKDV